MVNCCGVSWCWPSRSSQPPSPTESASERSRLLGRATSTAPQAAAVTSPPAIAPPPFLTESEVRYVTIYDAAEKAGIELNEFLNDYDPTSFFIKANQYRAVKWNEVDVYVDAAYIGIKGGLVDINARGYKARLVYNMDGREYYYGDGAYIRYTEEELFKAATELKQLVREKYASKAGYVTLAQAAKEAGCRIGDFLSIYSPTSFFYMANTQQYLEQGESIVHIKDSYIWCNEEGGFDGCRRGYEAYLESHNEKGEVFFPTDKTHHFYTEAELFQAIHELKDGYSRPRSRSLP